MAAFSRKTYEAVARIIRDAKNEHGRDGSKRSPATSEAFARDRVHVALEAVESEFADVFAADNSRFDRGRFADACRGINL